MNIQEAVIKAKEKNVGMRRKSWSNSHPHMEIIPTNTTNEFILAIRRNELCGCWQPDIDDLIANDWIVITPLENKCQKGLKVDLQLKEKSMEELKKEPVKSNKFNLKWKNRKILIKKLKKAKYHAKELENTLKELNNYQPDIEIKKN